MWASQVAHSTCECLKKLSISCLTGQREENQLPPFLLLFWALGINQDNKMQFKAVDMVMGYVQVRILLFGLWPQQQKLPSPPETTAAMPLIVSEEEVMAKRRKVTLHYFLGILPHTQEQRILVGLPDCLCGAATMWQGQRKPCPTLGVTPAFLCRTALNHRWQTQERAVFRPEEREVQP